MGLGKTVMTIALILARRGKGYPKNERVVMEEEDSKVKGGTLIVCPMPLLGQWKDSMASIFHKVEWHRVVLDEAHTIKSYKSEGAQAAFGLSSPRIADGVLLELLFRMIWKIYTAFYASC